MLRMAAKPSQPMPSPSSTPPPASCAKCRAALPSDSSAPPAAAPSRMANTTTPTPSLNRLSPATVARSAGGTAARPSTAITATGSVGEISAPNTSAHSSGTSMPKAPASSLKPMPTMAVETSTPSVLSARIGQRLRRMSPQSTCIAPANSRNDSIPSISVAWKSMLERKAASCGPSRLPPMLSTRITASEATAPITVRPMDEGSPSTRVLR